VKKVRVRVGALAAREDGAPLLAPPLDAGQDHLELMLVDDRADLGPRVAGSPTMPRAIRASRRSRKPS
jgi:hypothetical protein